MKCQCFLLSLLLKMSSRGRQVVKIGVDQCSKSVFEFNEQPSITILHRLQRMSLFQSLLSDILYFQNYSISCKTMWQASYEDHNGKTSKFYQMPPDHKLSIYLPKIMPKIDPVCYLAVSGCQHLTTKIFRYLDSTGKT